MEKARLPELNALPARSVDVRFPSATRKFWLWPNLLSLDAVFVALLWQQLFAEAASTSLFPAERAALGLAVWAIYVVDRILDSSVQPALPTARHIFYRQHRMAATLSAIGMLIAEAVICLFLSDGVLFGGLILTGVVMLHFLAVHGRGGGFYQVPKEISVAAVFAAGTVLAPLTKAAHRPALVMAALLFAVLCLLNCASVEYHEWKRFRYSERRAPPRSAVWMAENLTTVAGCVALCAILLLTHATLRELYGSVAVSSLALLWFDKTNHRMSADQMRVAADIPLLLPVLFLLARLHGL